MEFEENVPKVNKDRFLGICIVIAAVLITGTIIFTSRFPVANGALSAKAIASLEKAVLPEDGIVLPVSWGDMGNRLVESGVIDQEKFGDMSVQENNGKLVITKENEHTILNLLWAFGLGNKNDVLEKGPMMDPKYKGAGNFASTGGWTLAKGDAMNHYSMHPFITLTPDQQKLVEEVSKNIYRPCCGNSTYFPDCNHGMAMLGLLELMASQGVSEADMYKAALAVNSYWFPDTYVTIAQYLKSKGTDWKGADPKGILAANFSSGAGFAKIKEQIAPIQQKSGGGGCGI